jgi:serine/threonine protein kinase
LQFFPKNRHQGIPTFYLRWQGLVLTSQKWVGGIDFRQLILKQKNKLSVLQRFNEALADLVDLEAQFPLWIHGDLSPVNLIIQDAGPAIWIDWETSLEACRYQQESRLFVKPSYLAPERANGMSASKESDVFALGAILYELLSGQPLFSDDEKGIAESLCFSERNHKEALMIVPVKFRALLARALSPDPGQRPPSYLNFFQEFEGAFSQGQRLRAIQQDRSRAKKHLSTFVWSRDG